MSVIKWPELKIHVDNSICPKECYICGWNAAREACIKAYEQEPKLVPLDEKEVKDVILQNRVDLPTEK